MKWYNNYIFKFFGNRRLLTEDEFRKAMMVQFRNGKLRVIERRQHELLLDIAATADILMGELKPILKGNKKSIVRLLPIQQRLQSALMSYKIVEDDERTPPSTNAREELHLMDIPGEELEDAGKTERHS